MQKLKRVVFLLTASISVWSCSQKQSDKTATVASAYTYSNGQCYSSTGVVSPTSYCTNSTTTNGYSYNNGVCINTQTGVQAPNNTYCTTGATAGVAQQCSGYYTYQPTNGGASQYGNCDINTRNCVGYTLINSQGASVLCQ